MTGELSAPVPSIESGRVDSPAPSVVLPRHMAPAGPTPETEEGGVATSDAPTPRSAGFAEQAWDHAERRGFARRALPASVDEAPFGGAESPLAPAGPQEDSQSPQPPAPQAAAARAAPSLVSRAVLGFFSVFSMVALLIESTALAVSQMTQPLSQGFMALAGLVSVSYGAYALGSFLGGRWVDKFGIATSYRVVLATRAVIWTVAALLFNPVTGTVPLMFMVPLFAADYFVHSIGRIAEHKLQVAWFPDAPVQSSRFGSIREFIEYGAVFAAAAVGWAISVWGFGVVMYPTPVIFTVAAAFAWMLKSLPQFGGDKTGRVKLWAGIREVLSNKGILKPMIGYTVLNGVFFMLYYIVFTAFGAYVAGGNTEAAAKVSGSLSGLYGAGAMIGTLLMGWIANRIDVRTGHLVEPARTQARRHALAKSASRALVAAAVGLLGSWLFISQIQLASFIWPLFWISPALVILALTAQVAMIHVDTIMKDRIPADKKETMGGSIVGAIRALSYASQIAGFLLTGALFAAFGTAGFGGFAVLGTLAAASYIWLARDLGQTR